MVWAAAGCQEAASRENTRMTRAGIVLIVERIIGANAFNALEP
jgi:hypothetical protein